MQIKTKRKNLMRRTKKKVLLTSTWTSMETRRKSLQSMKATVSLKQVQTQSRMLIQSKAT